MNEKLTDLSRRMEQADESSIRQPDLTNLTRRDVLKLMLLLPATALVLTGGNRIKRLVEGAGNNFSDLSTEPDTWPEEYGEISIVDRQAIFNTPNDVEAGKNVPIKLIEMQGKAVLIEKDHGWPLFVRHNDESNWQPVMRYVDLKRGLTEGGKEVKLGCEPYTMSDDPKWFFLDGSLVVVEPPKVNSSGEVELLVGAPLDKKIESPMLTFKALFYNKDFPIYYQDYPNGDIWPKWLEFVTYSADIGVTSQVVGGLRRGDQVKISFFYGTDNRQKLIEHYGSLFKQGTITRERMEIVSSMLDRQLASERVLRSFTDGEVDLSNSDPSISFVELIGFGTY